MLITCQTSPKLAGVAVLEADDIVTGPDKTKSGQSLEDKKDKTYGSQEMSNSLGEYIPEPKIICSVSMESNHSCDSCLLGTDIQILSTDDLDILKDEDGTEIEIGRGRFGRVFLGYMKNRPEHVAIKQIIKGSSFQAKLQEAKMLKYLESTDIVPGLYGVVCDCESETVSLVQEYFGNGFTLYDLLKSPDVLQDTLPWISLCFQLVEGLQIIHGKGVLLNDIKINNVLVDMHKLRTKYIDVGQASVGTGRAFKSKLPEDDRLGYLAPEVRNGCTSSDKSDVYSLCYMLYQISMVVKIPKLTKIAYRGAAIEPTDRPSLAQFKANIGRLLFEY